VGTPGGGYDSISTNNTAAANDSSSNPRMYSTVIAVSSGSPVTSISFTYNSGGGHDSFFAVSYNVSGVTYAPIAVSGFNEELIEPALSPLPVTATMDLGTNLSSYYAYTHGSGMNTWFEKGYVRDTLADEAYGLPPSGSTFTSQAAASHHYQMGNYSANNAILIDAAHTNVNITPAVLTNIYGGFAFLTAGGNIGGNNVMTNVCILQHSDGVNETNLFYGYDWYNSQVTAAFIANGRVNMMDRAVNTVGGGNPKLFESYFTLNDTASPVTNIEVFYKTAPGANSTTFIMAVSASSGGVPPLITSGPLPAEQAAYPTTPVSFSVLVSGTSPVTNTWLIESNGLYVPLKDGPDANGSVISGSATTTLTVSDLAAADATNYEFIAANAFGSATSSPALLNLRGIAGVVPIGGWNNIANETFGVGNSTNIYSSDGSVTATLSLNDLGISNGYNSGITPDGSVDSLMHGYMDVGAGTSSDGIIAISGLTDVAYDVYIYCFPDTSRPQLTNGLPNYNVNGTTYYAPVLGGIGSTTDDLTGTPVGGTGFHGFIPATTYLANDFSADIPTNAFGNYIKIASVSASGGTITIDAGVDTLSFRSPVNGVELVSTSTSQKFGVHFLGNATDEIITPGQAPILDSQSPTNAVFSDFTNRYVNFSVAIDAISAPPLYYQWYLGSTPIPGATNSTYTTLDTNGATYQCVITNFAGSVTSSPVELAVLPLPTLSAYQSAVFAYQPLAYWPLNETSGNVARDWASTNDGTYKGNFTLNNPGVPATAGMGSSVAAGFDGSTAYVDIPVNNLNIVGPITVIAWCQTPASGSPDFGTVIGHSDQSYRISVVNGGSYPRFADAGPDVVGTVTAGDGNWHQIIGVYDGSKQYVYLDGKQTGNPLGSTPSGSGDDVEIGQAPDYAGQRNFDGHIAQVAILGQALSAAQVAALYNTVGEPPTVTVTPAAPSVYAGASQTFTAQTGGATPVQLKWYYINPAAPTTTNYIANATNATYTLVNAPLGDNGFLFGVVASNVSGAATADVPLTVTTAPAYAIEDIAPLNAEAYAGAPVTYTVVAGGTLPIFYQWSVDGVAVTGATNASFTAPAQCGQHTYQVSYTNAESAGTPIVSSVATLQGDAYPTNITFNTNGTGWQVNGTAASTGIVSNVLTLTTSPTAGEDSSAFYSIPQYVGSFTASFVYTGNGGADGTAFVIQNGPAGDQAIGGGGGDLGYAPSVTNSIAFEINLYSGNGEIPGVAAGTNGITFANGGSEYATPGSIGLGSTDPILVKLNFANGVLSVWMQDTASLYTYSANYTYGSLVPFLNANLGYVGFSGSDGGATSTQTITDFQFQSVIAALPLTISPVANGSVTISWSAVDPNYQLQQTSSLTSPAWTDSAAPTVVNGTAKVTVNVSGATTEFYRLTHVSPCTP
jgi:hypothetical protein